MGRKMIYLDDAIETIEEITWYHQNINKEMVSGANSSEHQAWYKADDVYKALESVPSAEPERKGEWIPVTKIYKVTEGQFPNMHIEWVDASEPDEIDAVRCSECGEVFDFQDARNWCTECGADMRGEKDE